MSIGRLKRFVQLFGTPARSDAKITLLIPTYNRAKLLEQAIDSVLDQAPDGVVVHVFDNASSDDTEVRMQRRIRAGEPLRYTRHAQNRGPIANFQFALASVATEFFVPLADDDSLVPGFLTQALRLMEADNTLGAAIFTTEARNERGESVGTYPDSLAQRLKGRLEPGEHLADWLRFGHYHWSSILWRRAVLKDVGAPYLHVGLPSDVDFQIRAFALHPVMMVDAPGAQYLIHEGQHGGLFSIEHLSDWAALFRNLDDQMARHSLIEPALYQALRRIARERYSTLWQRGDLPTGAHDLRALALSAGFALEDWDFAYLLAGLAEKAEPLPPLPNPPHWADPVEAERGAFDRIVTSTLRSHAH